MTAKINDTLATYDAVVLQLGNRAAEEYIRAALATSGPVTNFTLNAEMKTHVPPTADPVTYDDSVFTSLDTMIVNLPTVVTLITTALCSTDYPTSSAEFVLGYDGDASAVDVLFATILLDIHFDTMHGEGIEYDPVSTVTYNDGILRTHDDDVITVINLHAEAEELGYTVTERSE